MKVDNRKEHTLRVILVFKQWYKKYMQNMQQKTYPARVVYFGFTIISFLWNQNWEV